MAKNIEAKIREFVEKLEFTEDEIQSYAKEFQLTEDNMRRMAKRISKELKHDLKNVLAD